MGLAFGRFPALGGGFSRCLTQGAGCILNLFTYATPGVGVVGGRSARSEGWTGGCTRLETGMRGGRGIRPRGEQDTRMSTSTLAASRLSPGLGQKLNHSQGQT